MTKLWIRCGQAGAVALMVLVWCGCNSESTSTTVKPVETVRSPEELKNAAEKGDATAMVEWARQLLGDARQKSSSTQAVMWAERSAQLGNAEAEWLLSELYEAGRGLERSDAQSMDWAKRAAERGHVLATYSVGIKYATGRGVVKNKEESVRWLGRASTQGLALAQFNLAQRLEHGEGTITNLLAAWAWYRMASSGVEGIPDAVLSADRLHGVLSSEERGKATELFDAVRAAVKPATTPTPPR